MPGELVRAFVAITPPSEVKKVLVEIQETLQRQITNRAVRWVSPNGAHVTLKFLVKFSTEQEPAVRAMLRCMAQRASPFSLSLGGLGCFPDARNPRVIWVGMMGDLAQLHDMHAAVERGAARLGYEPEKRKFSPHLTLGRVRRSVILHEATSVGECVRTATAAHMCKWPVEEVTLLKSDLRPRGAVYYALGRYPLTGTGS